MTNLLLNNDIRGTRLAQVCTKGLAAFGRLHIIYYGFVIPCGSWLRWAKCGWAS